MNDQIQVYYKEKANKYKLFSVPGGVHAKIIDWAGAGKTVLDVGCAAGYLGAELKNRGNQVFGVEVSDLAARAAADRLDGVIVGNIEDLDLPYPKGHFDVIICADILEHLFQPAEALMKLRQYLKDDGVLIASIPNIAHWSVRLKLLFGRYDYEEAGLLDRGHIRFFTFDSALKMIRAAGFKVARYDTAVALPKGLNKVSYYLKFDVLLKTLFRGIFGYQFIFLLKKDKR